MPEQSESNLPCDAHEIEGIEIIERLGQGGMSLVYKARQLKLDRIVAVKVLSGLELSGEDAVRRFQMEAKVTSSCIMGSAERAG